MEQHEHILAETVAVSQLLIMLLVRVAATYDNPRAFLDKLLEKGIEQIGQQTLWGLPEERRFAVIEGAKARFSDMVVTAGSAF